MLIILITGARATGKSRIAREFIKHLRQWGFVSFEVWTTNEPITIPSNSTKEE